MIKKIFYLVGLGISSMMLSCAGTSPKQERPYTVAAYYFPNYHVDARNERMHGTGWTEWELVKNAKPRFEGHRQPIKPLWGYTDEADAVDMAQKIDAAYTHGIDAFIFDWYYYDDGQFLERALEEGFMKAENNGLLKFALMWANHDWEDIHPFDSRKNREMLYPGKITKETWDKMTDFIVEKYFSHPSYWQINGAPYFSIYDLTRFIEIFGSVADTRKGIDAFREKARKAGFRDINLNAVVWGRTVLPSEEVVSNPAALVEELGFDSFTSYVWIHHVGLNQFPATSYDSVSTEYFTYAEEAVKEYKIPYYPNMTMGWDASPRTHQATAFENLGYPYMPVIVGNTPEAFKKSLVKMKKFVDQRLTGDKIITVNCWNEWTEGSYLEPDTKHGMAYLEAIRDVFGKR